jgi:hypothetical protein
MKCDMSDEEKIICKICGREFKRIMGLMRHVYLAHKMKSEDYYLKYINSVKGVCKTCGNETKYVSISHGYHDYCSLKCVQNNELIIIQKTITCFKNHGVKYPLQSEVLKRKTRKTCRNRFGCENPMQNEIVQNKGKATCLENNGVEHALQNKKIKKRQEDTCFNNLGTTIPMKNKIVAAKAGKKLKLNFLKLLKKFPELVIIENLKEGPNGEILGHCKNASCQNSKENGGSFELTTYQIQCRNLGINSPNDGNYFYCCEECKKECILFGKSAKQLNTIVNQTEIIYHTSQEYSIWRNEVFTRQKIESIRNENFCEICESTESLHCHHEIPIKINPNFALDPDNGIILCRDCHHKYGHKKGTECSIGNLANLICQN